MPALNLKKTYQKYPEYKDSGVDWLKKIPLGWNLLPVRAVLKERKEKNSKLEIDNILSVMKDVGVIRYADKGDVGNKSSDRPEAYKIVRSGDIVLNSMNLSIGSVGIAREEGVTSSVYIIYGPRQAVSTTDFYHYLFETTQFQRHLASYGKGIMELREAVREINIRNQIIIAPSLDTQKIISDFLDKKIKIIDQIIKKKQKLISLLQEKRSALITHAVTKGLDPKTKMKLSGIDWIGEIPENWKINRIKNLLNYYSRGGTPEYSEENTDFKFINQSCIRDGYLDLKKIKYATETPSKGNLKKGDILINSTGTGTLGRTTVFEENNVYFADTHITILRPKKIISKYLSLMISMNRWQDYIYSTAVTGSTNQIELSPTRLVQIPVIVPDIDEQKIIINFLKLESNKIDKANKMISDQIEKIKEYRSSLIYHAVTGKIKI